MIFGVFKDRFHILATSCCSFLHQVLSVIMRLCIILHNIIIEDGCIGSYDTDDYKAVESSFAVPTIIPEASMGITIILWREVGLHASPLLDQL